MGITEKLENIIRICRYEDDVDKKVGLLLLIDNLLPNKYKLKIPSYVTRDYIDVILNEIEKKIEYQKLT
ncbi:MAG: hypothetical protein WCB31_08920 [Nitrososphaeraceae archaeon]